MRRLGFKLLSRPWPARRWRSPRCCWPVPASAQDYPTRAIRLICPFPPGGVADTVARVVGQRMSEVLGQPVVIDNRTGASGTRRRRSGRARATPDGYTLLMTTGDFITVPQIDAADGIRSAQGAAADLARGDRAAGAARPTPARRSRTSRS